MTTKHPLFRRIQRHTNLATLLREPASPQSELGSGALPTSQQPETRENRIPAVKAVLLPNENPLPLGRTMESWVPPPSTALHGPAVDKAQSWEQPTVLSRRPKLEAKVSEPAFPDLPPDSVQRTPDPTPQIPTLPASDSIQAEHPQDEQQIDEENEDPAWNRLQAIMDRHRDRSAGRDQTVSAPPTSPIPSAQLDLSRTDPASVQNVEDTIADEPDHDGETQPETVDPQGVSQNPSTTTSSAEKATLQRAQANSPIHDDQIAGPLVDNNQGETILREESRAYPHDAPTIVAGQDLPSDLPPGGHESGSLQRQVAESPEISSSDPGEGRSGDIQQTVSETPAIVDSPLASELEASSPPAKDPTDQTQISLPNGPKTAPPLQDAWPVQRRELTAETVHTSTHTQDLETPPSSPTEGPMVNPQILEILNRPTGQEGSGSTIEVIPPRRPRPTKMSAVPLPAVQTSRPAEEEKISDLPSSPQETIAAADPSEAAGIKTDIGQLPADLWRLIGQEPPAPSGEVVEPAASSQAPSHAAEMIQRAEEVQEKEILPPSESSSGSSYDDGPVRGQSVKPDSPLQTVLQLEPSEQRETGASGADAGTEQSAAEDEPRDEIDIAALARQVYPEIKRRLALEKERTRK